MTTKVLKTHRCFGRCRPGIRWEGNSGLNTYTLQFSKKWLGFSILVVGGRGFRAVKFYNLGFGYLGISRVKGE